MGPVVLDTSVVIAAIEARDAHHAECANALTDLRKRAVPMRLAAITVAELFAMRGEGRAARLEKVRAFIGPLGEGAVVPMDRAMAERAGELRASRRRIGLADAVIKATAEQIDADSVLTTDRDLARLDGVTFVGSARR